MQYWKTHQKDIIMKYLLPIKEAKAEFTLWQQIGGRRLTLDGKFLEVSRKFCKIKLRESNNLQYFDSTEPFYVHIKELDVIFKKDHYTQMGQFLEFGLPADIQIYERRKTKRYYYLYQDHKNITYHSEKKDPSTEEPLFTLSSVLVDISTQGAGMVVGKEAINDLYVGQKLFLDNLTDQKLPAPFRVKVMYIELYKTEEKGLYKIGIIFDDQLNSISYKSISSIIEIKQKKTQGLSQDAYCGLDSEEQIQTLNNIGNTNQVLANNLKDNIEYLDKLRYLTTQMKVELLQDINQDVLAVALRLSSRELIYDLFTETTQNRQKEFLEKLQTERPPSAICKAQDQIIKELREKESRGEIVLDPKGFITYV